LIKLPLLLGEGTKPFNGFAICFHRLENPRRNVTLTRGSFNPFLGFNTARRSASISERFFGVRFNAVSFGRSCPSCPTDR
jgi:hypothetical protein